MTCINENLRKTSKVRKVKKKQIQILSSNASEILIDQWEQIKQNKKNNSEKVFIEKNKNWCETILYEIKILQIKKIDKLMTCE